MIPDFFRNLERFATRPQGVQRDEIAGIAWGFYNIKVVSLPSVGGNRALYLDKTDADRGYKHFAELISKDDEMWKKHLSYYKKSTNELFITSKSKSNNMQDVYSKWVDSIKKFGLLLMSPYAIERVLDPECRKLLQKEFGYKADEAFSIISSPDKLNDYQKMRLDMCELVISNKINDAKIKTLVKEYGWYSEYSFVEKLLDDDYFRNELNKLNVKRARDERNKITRDVDTNKKEYEDLKKKLKSHRLKLLADIIHTYVYLRTERIDNFKRAQTNFRLFFDELARLLSKKTGENWYRLQVVNLLNEEVLDFLNKEKVPDINIVNERVSQNYIYYHDDKAHLIYSLDEIKEVQKMIEESEKTTEIKGMVAFKGKVSGNVVIVLNKSDLSKVKEGDIMVSKITMPDYAPAMKLAAAFVTEEGGITSHAAITARELRKPCIVGTGNCTKSLKDGDFIEVDANKGIVRKIK